MGLQIFQTEIQMLLGQCLQLLSSMYTEQDRDKNSKTTDTIDEKKIVPQLKKNAHVIRIYELQHKDFRNCNLEYAANLHLIYWEHHIIQEMDEDIPPPPGLL